MGAPGAGRLRITHVVASPNFHGTERYVVDAANSLARRGHQVTVVGGDRSLMVEALDATVRHRPGHDGRAALESLLRVGKQDIVHAHLLRSERLATLAWPSSRCPRVVTEHLERIVPATRVGRLQEHLLARTTSLRIAVSRSVAARLPWDRPVTVLHNGVESVEHTTRPHVAGNVSSGTVLVAQRLHRSKDTATALRAWSSSGLGDRGWRLLVAGDGQQRSVMADLACSLGTAGSVELLGWRPDVHDLMAEADVFLATSLSESLGLSVLEAMARAVPVVASDIDGHRETAGTLDDVRLFRTGDVAHCARLLVELADDPDERRDYGARLREVQQESFDQNCHVEALEGLYLRTTT